MTWLNVMLEMSEKCHYNWLTFIAEIRPTLHNEFEDVLLINLCFLHRKYFEISSAYNVKKLAFKLLAFLW